jgi:hypothetical protein
MRGSFRSRLDSLSARTPSVPLTFATSENRRDGEEMGIVNTTTVYDNNFDFAKASTEDVYFAFIINVPFRFRVSSPFHSHFQSQGNEYDLWIINKPMEVTEPGMRLHSLVRQGGKVEDFWSTVAIVPNKGKITIDELAIVQNCHGNVDSVALESRTGQSFPAMQALNAFIIGYHIATGEMWGGHPLQAMTVDEYMNRLSWEVNIIGIPLSYWTSDTINNLFDLKGGRAGQVSATLSGEMFDLPADKLAGIGQAIERLNTFYFYELAFESKAKMVSSDYIGALLMAVAALEGVHGAYVSHVLEAKLPTGRTGDDKNLEENFVKELGFSLCNKLTPYLFMETTERPPQELIQKAATAVRYRNEVMHALRNSSGAYRIRTRTNAELSDAYSAVLQLFDCYRKAFETAMAATSSAPFAGLETSTA